MPISPTLRAAGGCGGRHGEILGGRYRLVELVRAGGMATVHRAWDVRLEREVAVKVIAARLARNATSVRRFRVEAQLCARLSHPNVVTVLDAGVEPKDFIVMEFVDGLDARALLEQRRSLTASEAVYVLAQVCDGLAHVHARGVIHGDVSLGNILIGRTDGAAKLADFGLSASLDTLAGPGKANPMGTPGYVAPEVLHGAGTSRRSDLYSLAVAAYRLLVGPPRPGEGDPDATMPGPTAAPRMSPLSEARPDLPRRLADTIQRALAQDAAARHESVAQFRDELLHGATTAQPRTVTPAHAPRAALPRAA